MAEKLVFENLIPENGIVIAEVACGHEGSFDRVKQLVDVVAESDTDIIKYQIFFTSERAIKGEKEWDIFNGLTFDERGWEKVIDYSRSAGLWVMADVFGYNSFQLALDLGVDGFKIHSEDLLNSFFISDVVKSGKLTLLGIGGSKRKELYELCEFLTESNSDHSIVLMTGVQTFPTPLESHSIFEVGEIVEKYSNRYRMKVGFADHVSGDSEEAMTLPLMALCKGAVLIEKHLTIDRRKKWIDYYSALNADEFINFVRRVKRLAPLLSVSTMVTPSERAYRKMFKKTIFANREIEARQKICPKDITYIKNARKAIPLSSIEISKRPVTRLIPKGKSINRGDLEQNVGAIIVVRVSSSRMYGKALMKIGDRESIKRVIDRVKRMKRIGSIILATSTDASDDVLVDIAESEGIDLYRGSLNNVAERFLNAALEHELNHFVRVTGDCILCDNIMADRAIESHLRNANDITFIRNMPFGTNKEVISLPAIKTIYKNAAIPENTEYLEYYLNNNKIFNVGYVVSKYKFSKSLRMTLDYEEDLEFFNRLFRHFDKVNPKFELEDAISFLMNNPDIVSINSHLRQKFMANQINTSLAI
ncbi:MAG: N-acetylneuraminate synthase family protein [Dehalococcoidia bacterium]|nr:N-acetylneuraminate synthase family protein [Dehalococcoidia bacterium]